MSINAQTLFNLLEKEMGREALSHAMFSFLSSSGAPEPPSKTAPSAPAPAVVAEEKPKKKAKAKRDPDAPKRPASDWCLFVKRCSEVMKEHPIEGSKVSAMKVASALKNGAGDSNYSSGDEHILAAYKQLSENALLAPEEPKAGKPTDGNETDTSSTSSFTTANGEKKKKQWSAEAKASAAAKRAEKKAAKASVLATAPVSNPFDDSDVQNFAPFVYQKKTFLKNGRGDVLTEDMEWVGHWDDGKGSLDKSATQPADLDI
jgi:hypothetical protein